MGKVLWRRGGGVKSTRGFISCWIIPRRISLQHLKAVKCAVLLLLLLVIGRRAEGKEGRERGRLGKRRRKFTDGEKEGGNGEEKCVTV